MSYPQQVTLTTLTKSAIYVIAVACSTWLLEKMSAALIPFIFAIFLYYNMLPVMRLVERRWKVSHYVTVLIALLFYALVYIGLSLMVASNIRVAINSADLYQERLVMFYDQLAANLSGWGVEISQEELRTGLKNNEVFAWFSNFSGGVAGLLGNIGLVLIFLLFILSSPIQHEHPIMSSIEKQLTRYIIAKTIVAIVTGLLVGVSLAILGVDMAALFGLLSFLLSFIPNLGSLIAVLLLAPVVLMQTGLGTTFVLALVIPGVIQFVIGSFIEPRLIGDALDLHPITVLLSLVYWGIVWGITGMFLAVPITAVMKIVFERFESTRPMAKIMSGRFA